MDAFAQAFERVLRFTVTADLPGLEATARRRMGSAGGEASKRRPGPLRRVLEDICREIDSTESDRVFAYWQRYATSFYVDNAAPEDSCHWKHGLRGVRIVEKPSNPVIPTALGPIEIDADVVQPPPANHFEYRYFDGERDAVAKAHDISRTLHRIRVSR